MWNHRKKSIHNVFIESEDYYFPLEIVKSVLIYCFFFCNNFSTFSFYIRSVSTSDIIRLQDIEQRRNQILGIRAQSVSVFHLRMRH